LTCKYCITADLIVLFVWLLGIYIFFTYVQMDQMQLYLVLIIVI